MIEPRGNKLLVKVDQVEEKTKAGIIMPKMAQESEQRAANTGVVKSIGKAAWVDQGDGTPWAKAGERVIFVKYAGVVVKHQNEDYLILPDIDVIGVIKD